MTLQILIDTNADTVDDMRRVASLLIDAANARESVPDVAQPLDTFTPVTNADGSVTVGQFTAKFDVPPPPPVAPVASGDEEDPDVETDDVPPPPLPLPASVPLPAAPSAGPLVPPPPVPPPPGPAAPVELDSRGMPWDSRIHASNRAKKIDGSWKNRRGVDPNLVTTVEATYAPGPTQAATAAAPLPPSVVPPAISGAAVPASAFAVAPPPPPAVTLPATTAIASGVPSAPPPVIDFRGLMQKIQAASAAGKLSPDQVNAALAGVGLRPEEMAQLINNAPLIASVNAAIDACLA